MEARFFCPIWGSERLRFNEFLKKVKDAGYDGVEMSLPFDLSEKEEILGLIKKFNLLFIAQHWETSISNFEVHKLEFRKRLENLASARPLLINTQTGKDYFSFDQNAELIAIADIVSQDFGIKIVHETHRGKFSFAAQITADYLNRLPYLRLCLDLSHWCNVSESYLDDQLDTVNLALSRADHIHARVGFSEGPQITDPRVPEWQEALQVHLHWWQEVIRRKQNSGQESVTITPEFGPFPYMTILPYTQQPITDQWEINVFMMKYLKSALQL